MTQRGDSTESVESINIVVWYGIIRKAMVMMMMIMRCSEEI